MGHKFHVCCYLRPAMYLGKQEVSLSFYFKFKENYYFDGIISTKQKNTNLTFPKLFSGYATVPTTNYMQLQEILSAKYDL